MGRIQWNNSLSIGVDEIDDQHKKLIDLHNHLHDTILGLNGEDSNTVTKAAIKEMMDYTEHHFRCEQEYMEKIGYPDVVTHIRLHSLFEDEVYQHFRAAINGEYILPTQVITLTITTEDRKIGEFIKIRREKVLQDNN